MHRETEKAWLKKSTLVILDETLAPVKMGFYYSTRFRGAPPERIEKWSYLNAGKIRKTPGAEAEAELIQLNGIVDNVEHLFIYVLCDDVDGDMSVEIIWDCSTGWIAEIHRTNVEKMVRPFVEKLTFQIRMLFTDAYDPCESTSSFRVHASKSAHKRCAQCQKSAETMSVCANCKSAHYCNRDCQRLHWKEHKKTCAKK